LADPPMGVLFSLAISSVAIYGVMLAGWSSGSKYPLLGSIRASAQMVSYEAAMGLSLAAVVLASRSLRTQEIVANQAGSFARWHLIALGGVPAIIFAIAATAELNRPPFDLVEAEQELVGGFNTEYSSARFAFFFLAEFMNTITMSALIVTLFLGGPTMPFSLPILGSNSVVYFVIKLLALLFTYVWLRGTLPRFRYDQLMDLGWKKLIPAALFWLLLIAAIRIDRKYLIPAGLAVAAAAGLLFLAMRAGRQTSQAEHEDATAKTLSTGRPGRF
jgi:NADH-quinone oxidoreductase subunit H